MKVGMMSYVLGIDPSISATGVCLLYDDKPPVFKTVGEKDSQKPLSKRLWHLQTKLIGCLDQKSNPLLVAIETPISPLALRGFGGTGFNNNLMAYAMAYEMMGKFNLPYVEISTKQRAMIATGKGNSDKNEVIEAFCNIHDIEVNHNEIDAYWLAMGAAEVYAQSNQRLFVPYGNWLELDDRTYDMIDKLEIT